MKKQFLINIIKNAPNDSILKIDYWDTDLEKYLPSLIKNTYTIDIDFLGKDFLIEKIKIYPIEELITHLVLLKSEHVLLKSFDTFEIIQVSEAFNYFKQSDYPDISINSL